MKTLIHSAVIHPDDVKVILKALDNGSLEDREKAVKILEDRTGANASEEDKIEIARVHALAEGAGEDGETEFDDKPSVSIGSDPGSYVQAWVWFPREE